MKKINLGSGPHTKQGWDNLDIEPHPGVTVTDLSQAQLLYENESVDFAFSEHFVEHITKPQFIALLKEVYRVLKPGGIFRVSTPDLRAIVDDYIAGKVDRWGAVWLPETPCELLNLGLRLWGHLYVYDRAELILVANSVGFEALDAIYSISGTPELSNLEVRPYLKDLIMELRKPL